MKPTLPMITVDGKRFRDLDHDGVLAPYEDHRLDAPERARDLLSRMTVDEKIGVLMHGTARADGPLGELGVGAAYDEAACEALVQTQHINHLISRLSLPAGELAAQNNRLQVLAAGTRLGIPVTISTDPRHHFEHLTGASSTARGFSQWPEMVGLAAIGSTDLVREFGEVVRREYRAVGLHMALSPQADIASEPRWSRISGTFGEDPNLARRLVNAYVLGAQGASQLSADGVACIAKHWVGYPAAPEGFDAHNAYGRFSTVTETSLPAHIEPFLGAFEAGVAGVMPTYTVQKDLVLNGAPVEAVAGGFSRELITDLLRGEYGFDGLVLSDWAIYRDLTTQTVEPTRPQGPPDIAMPWGVETLSRSARFARSLHAGVDQFGGEEDVQCLGEVLAAGLVEEQMLDSAVYRALLIKFTLGLFDDPLVDADAADDLAGGSGFAAAGVDAQRRAVICLKRPQHAATAPIVRMDSPRQLLHPQHFFGQRQHEGDLDYKAGDPQFETLLDSVAAQPTIAVVRMTRPTIVADWIDEVDGLFVDLGVGHEVMDEVIREGTPTEATVPFELPHSMDAVRSQRPDVPADSDAPTFPVGTDYRSRP